MRTRHLLPNYRIAVVGAGAIGSYYGGKLAHLGRDVHFLLRSDYETIRRRGLRIVSKGENIHVPNVRAYRATAAMGLCDLVIVAVKTTSNPDLPSLIGPLLGEKTMILTLQNGLGNEEFLAGHFGAARILGGLCFIGLNRTAPGLVERFDAGRLRLGEFEGFPKARTHDLSWEFKRCGVVCTVVADLARERWRKLVWNIPFNGLTIVAGGLNTDALLADEHWRTEALALMDETIAIANAYGHNIPTAFALELLQGTGTRLHAYKPSTLLDYEAGKPLELEAIWGEPLRRGQAARIKTPRLEELYHELSLLDRSRQE
jgi:2-dehydropantoate 2-reductase